MDKISGEKKSKIFFKGVISGIGWSFGTTFGFIIIITLATHVLNLLGGLPLIGDFLAKIVVITNKAIETKSGI
jgi:phage shock protein PspC (stress-responsive transcriptional regulator)